MTWTTARLPRSRKPNTGLTRGWTRWGALLEKCRGELAALSPGTESHAQATGTINSLVEFIANCDVQAVRDLDFEWLKEVQAEQRKARLEEAVRHLDSADNILSELKRRCQVALSEMGRDLGKGASESEQYQKVEAAVKALTGATESLPVGALTGIDFRW